jgi:SpoVK/Ycf46/Vps4 family AAA+-type ATPase
METFKSWSDDGKEFNWQQRTVLNLPAGVYTMDSYGGLSAKPIKHQDFSGTIATSTNRKIWETIDKFFQKEKEYEKVGIAHKMGIFLTGNPGTGKTSALKYAVSQSVEKHDAIVVMNCTISTTVSRLAEVESGRKIIYIYEDLDSTIADGDDFMCEILDGLTTTSRVVFIATTNHPEEIPPRLIRPGRFDTPIEFKWISEADRRLFFTEKLKGVEKLNLIPSLLKKSKKMSYAEMTELVIQTLGLK